MKYANALFMIVAMLALALGGCANLPEWSPKSEDLAVAWYPMGTTHTLARSSESGAQMLFGNRHKLATGADGAASGGDIDKQPTEAVAIAGMSLAGAAIGGALLGSPGLGAAVGGIAGSYMGNSEDAQTTAPAAGAAALQATRAGGGLKPGGAAGPVDIAGAGQSPLNAAAGPMLANLLKGYLTQHPEACRLMPLLGQEGVLELIDQLVGGSTAGGGGATGADLAAIAQRLLEAKAATGAKK